MNRLLSISGIVVFVAASFLVTKTVRVTIIDDNNNQQQAEKEEKIKSKEEVKNDYVKFKRHVRGAARLAKKNVNLSEPAEK